MSIISKKFLNAASAGVLLMTLVAPGTAGAESPIIGPQPEEGEKTVSRTFGPQLPAHTEKPEQGIHPQTRLRGEHREVIQVDAGKLFGKPDTAFIGAAVESRNKQHALHPTEGHVVTAAGLFSLKF